MKTTPQIAQAIRYMEKGAALTLAVVAYLADFLWRYHVSPFGLVSIMNSGL